MFVVEFGISRDERGFDGDEIFDQFITRHRRIEADRHIAAARGARMDADRRAGPGERIDELGTGLRIFDGDGANALHDHVVVRMSAGGVRRARVIAVGRNAAWIVALDSTELQLAQFRKGARAVMPVPGDIVAARTLDEDRVVIDAIEPRSFALVRHTGGGRTKTMAANIDTIAIVAALVDPPIHFAMLDGLIAFAVQHDVAAALILTKPDLAEAGASEHVAAIYEPLGVATLTIQPTDGIGLEALRSFLAERKALLVGNSGVGKSTIFRALGGLAVIGELSRFGRGRQTTSSARLFQTGTGFLIDSPGIGEFALDPLPATELAHLFVEMREPASRCRFRDCHHTIEPDCGVRAALEAGRIAPSRYASYREILG